jgi:hypothetical protein
MTDVMIDLETYSTLPNAAILTLGAVKFNREDDCKKIEDMEVFYRKIDLDSNTNRHIDENTVEWWKKQSIEAKNEALGPGGIKLKKALKEFSNWYGESNCIWSHGDDFDTVIISDAMRNCNVEIPWKFYETRDTRTLFDLAKVYNYQLPQASKHHALYDCHRQIAGVLMALRKLKL